MSEKTKVPRWLDPATLRWVVDEWVTEEGKALRLRALDPAYGEGGVRREGLKTEAQKVGASDVCKALARGLNGVASRREYG